MPEPEILQLLPGETATIAVKAGARYSATLIAVAPGEGYEVTPLAGQRWVDLVIPSSPAGYTNMLAKWVGMRVPSALCMCLCAAFNEQDTNALPVGNGRHITNIPVAGTMSFFANDVPGFEWNNFGTIQIVVARIH